MKSIIKGLAAFAVVLGMFSQPIGASAADVFHFRGQAVDATFVNIDPSGCIYTSVDLVAAEQIPQAPPGAPQPSAWIYAHYFQADFCTNTVFHSASASVPLSESELDFTGKLHLATLHTTVSMFDYVTNAPLDITLDLTWTANSSRLFDNAHGHYNFEGCHLVYRSDVAHRFADVSGTVSDGTTDFGRGLSQSWGTIFSANEGSIVHGCD